MVNLSFDIDAIVRQVIADLDAKGVCRLQTSDFRLQESGESSNPKSEARSPKPETLRLPDSLVTLALLEGRLDGVREVVISPKAVVTPSVRDLLYKKEVGLRASGFRLQEERLQTTDFGLQEKASIVNPEARSLKPEAWLALHQLKREPETLIGFLQGKATLAKESFNCIVATTQAAAKRLAESETLRAIIVTNHSATAMVLANRHAAIRAVIGESTDQTVQDAAMIGANLLVLHADRIGAWRMKELARVFLANRSRHCPDFMVSRKDAE